MTYSELLQQLTVESQDNGEVFTRTNRLERIKNLLHDSSYELLYVGKLALIYGKKGVTPAKARLLVSSHIDTVYTHVSMRKLIRIGKGHSTTVRPIQPCSS